MNVHQIAENLPANLIEIAQKCTRDEFKAVLQHFEILRNSQEFYSLGSVLHFSITDDRFYGLAGCFIHGLGIFCHVHGIDAKLSSNWISARLEKVLSEHLDDYEDKCETLINSVCDIAAALQANGFTHHHLYGNLSVAAFRKVFYNHLMK